MCFNAGKIDRLVRVILGVSLISFGIISEYLFLPIIGIIPLVTGLLGYCPFYPILKINTGCKKD